jgi:hypothetical protein
MSSGSPWLSRLQPSRCDGRRCGGAGRGSSPTKADSLSSGATSRQSQSGKVHTDVVEGERCARSRFPRMSNPEGTVGLDGFRARRDSGLRGPVRSEGSVCPTCVHRRRWAGFLVCRDGRPVAGAARRGSAFEHPGAGSGPRRAGSRFGAAPAWRLCRVGGAGPQPGAVEHREPACTGTDRSDREPAPGGHARGYDACRSRHPCCRVNVADRSRTGIVDVTVRGGAAVAAPDGRAFCLGAPDATAVTPPVEWSRAVAFAE